MTAAENASALVARGIAAGSRLGHFTLVFVDPVDPNATDEENAGRIDVPAVVDRASNTIWIRKGDSLEDAIFVLYACFDKLVGGTVVQGEHGDLGVVPDAVGAEGMIIRQEQPRPRLRVVR